VEKTEARFQERAPFCEAAGQSKLLCAKPIFPPTQICPNHNKKAGLLASLESLVSGLHCRSGGICLGEPHIFYDGRERIRVCEIHQMNYFDDDVCLPGMQGWVFSPSNGS
jgi:hypothetical protein